MLRGRRRDRRSRARSRARRRCWRGSAASGRGRCCSPTSTSTTRAPRARWCAAGPTSTSTCTSAARRTSPNPERLVASAARLYGGEEGLRETWGEVVPVPEERLHVLSGGETVLGFEVAYTPGHASHHVCYFTRTGGAFVGDMAGVRVPPYDLTLAPTPPPDIDVEAWERSLDTIAAWEPDRPRADALRDRGRPAGPARGRARGAALGGRPGGRARPGRLHGRAPRADRRAARRTRSRRPSRPPRSTISSSALIDGTASAGRQARDVGSRRGPRQLAPAAGSAATGA